MNDLHDIRESFQKNSNSSERIFFIFSMFWRFSDQFHKMPLIEVLDSDSEEEEKKVEIDDEEFNTSSLNPMHCHPASFTKSRIFEYTFDRAETSTSTHPGASRREFPRDVKRATEFKEEGNRCFKAKDYDKAVEYFTRAIYTVPVDTDRYHYNTSVYVGEFERETFNHHTSLKCITQITKN